MKKIFSFALLSLTLSAAAQEGKLKASRTLIVFFDGLRPDYITPENMPNLYALKKAGVYGTSHHSVFPTVTRVNSSSYATGSYPQQNGLMGNSVFFPKVKKNGALDTGDARDLNSIDSAMQGHLLTSISLGEILQRSGKTMMVFSSGSTGQALLQNHKVNGGAIINPDMILPASIRDSVIRDLGQPQAYSKDNGPRHEWVANALIKYGLVPDGPSVNAVWFSDPDGCAHRDGIGSPAAMEAIKKVDAQLGRILQTLDDRDLRKDFNILFSTDHGFVTYAGKDNITDLLIRHGLKENKESEDVVVAGGSIHVRDHNKETVRKIVEVLQAEPWIGSIFTRGKNKKSTQGWVPGTLSFSSIHWDNADRSGDVLADYNWNDDKNNTGYAGTSMGKGVAGHGSMSPYEVHIPLIASGPDFIAATESALPTSNVDITPTVLFLQGLKVPSTMDGRVLRELLAANRVKMKAPVTEHVISTANGAAGSYKVDLQVTKLGDYRYIDFSKVVRISSSTLSK
ncbi:MAG: alkaline phosphatase family protein [Chitinophagaceae bacterium]|nr:MAG: alkaline phosphatase family protein [Chitinophagaceae bacterium]